VERYEDVYRLCYVRGPAGIIVKRCLQSPEQPCEAVSMIRRVESDDWECLRDVRLRALASDPDAFLETVEDARTLPDERWRERARPSEHDVTFVHERDDAFDGMVSAFVDDDAETVHLVGMWVAPDLRGSGVARELVGRIIECRAATGACVLSSPSRQEMHAPHAYTRNAASSNLTRRRRSRTSRIQAPASTRTR
jgi:GNAT superfamily N-acetyltransferase